MLPAVDAWKSHQNELRHLEPRAVGTGQILEHLLLGGKRVNVVSLDSQCDSRKEFNTDHYSRRFWYLHESHPYTFINQTPGLFRYMTK